MPEEDASYQVAVRLPPDLRDALIKRAESEDRPIARIIRSALRAYLRIDMPESDEDRHLARIMQGG
jgi:predicted transcriptional regulator